MTYSITKIYDVKTNTAVSSACFISESAERNSMDFSTECLTNLKERIYFILHYTKIKTNCIFSSSSWNKLYM